MYLRWYTSDVGYLQTIPNLVPGQASSLKRVPAVFYKTEAGGEPVRDWIRKLSKGEKRLIGEDIKTVEFGWPIGMPTCRPMGDGLHEVRTSLPRNRIARVLFYIDRAQKMVLLHSLIKKSGPTPQNDLEIARRNKKRHEDENA